MDDYERLQKLCHQLDYTARAERKNARNWYGLPGAAVATNLAEDNEATASALRRLMLKEWPGSPQLNEPLRELAEVEKWTVGP